MTTNPLTTTDLRTSSRIDPGVDSTTMASARPETDRVGEMLAAMRLASPTLPIGAFAYSQGLEYAVEVRWVHDGETAERWISGIFAHAVTHFDLPLLARLYRAYRDRDFACARRHERSVLAGRESSELRAEELQLGGALARLLVDLGYETGTAGHGAPGAVSGEATYLGAFARAATLFGVSERSALASYCFAWLEHQTSAATRLVPLGHTEGQRVLGACLLGVDHAILRALAVDDDDIGALAPGQALASALHETQYTRLFRS
jgi:urease accessory protein